MIDFDKITIRGHVGRDPSAPVPSSPNFVTFSVAVDKSRKTSDGGWEKRPNWYGCNTSNNDVAQMVMEVVKKGTPIYLEGVPAGIKSYKNREGVLQHIINIDIKRLDDIRVLTPKPKNNDFVNLKNEYNKPQETFPEDDIPF